MEDIGPACPLPQNKSFHVYFLYKPDAPDKAVVNKLASTIEPLGYRCCYHDNNSMAGNLIIDNFWTLLNNSMKIIIIFSKAFVESCWSDYEVSVIISLCMERNLRVIPLLIDQSEIPEKISCYMHVLDISGPDMEWQSKFLQSVCNEMEILYQQFANISLDDSHLCGVSQGESGPWESIKLPCMRYDTRRFCYRCSYPHVCRDYIIHDACNAESCDRSHDILDAKTKPLLQTMGFDVSKPRDQLVTAYRLACNEILKYLPRSRVTGPCSYYNNANRECLDSVNGCPFPHICIRWFQGKCNFTQDTCPFVHNFSDPNTRTLLQGFNIDLSCPEDEILRSYRAKYHKQQI